MSEIVIDHPSGEASGLLTIENPSVLEAQGWETGFWICGDEQPVDKALGAIGRKGGLLSRDGWELCHVPGAFATSKKKTEDCEAMARRGSWIYIFGSHFGTKSGSLQSRRHFVARFDESKIQGSLEKAEIPIEIARGGFRLHRLINDAFQASGLKLLEPGEETRQSIEQTIKKGKKKGKRWARRIQEEDYPVNIEGATFRDSGALLLGLRYPVTRDGHPILVEIDDVDKLFLSSSLNPIIHHLWILENLGSPEKPRGIRGLELFEGQYHVITGTIDSTPEESVALHDHPEGDRAPSRHHRFTLPEVRLWSGVQAELVDPLKEVGKRVEGLSVDDDGTFRYVIDDEKIRLREGGRADRHPARKL
ncbi:MAG TPA: hypothetical protein VG477_03085 [Thermoanaerobaculia bacterium]|nr:hypothetical protein [Thermoanaerobaculia bacterium]